MPSSYALLAKQLKDPGALPPTSDQCAVDVTKAMSSRSWKSGFTKWMSLQWVLAT